MDDSILPSPPARATDGPPGPPGFALEPGKAELAEVFVAPREAGSASAFVFAHMPPPDRPWLWVQERRALGEGGMPCLHGLPRDFRAGLIHAVAANAKDALWAMEEGLRCPGLAFVVGEIHGDPRALDFTATRRLAVASEKHGVPAFLLRLSGRADLSGARKRWRIAARPSLVHCWDAGAPGRPRIEAELFRARSRPPGRWELAYERAANRLDLAPEPRDGALAREA